ncbi:hypothetical protein JTB14_009188 [Gonioctena quinquepunctata]|nr:hypothetical protein JTB14_009188 [Gonioctena quinquepunctata]
MLMNILLTGATALTATAAGSLCTTALKPLWASAVYSTVRLVPSDSIRSSYAWTTSPFRDSCWLLLSPVGVIHGVSKIVLGWSFGNDGLGDWGGISYWVATLCREQHRIKLEQRRIEGGGAWETTGAAE